MVKSKCYIFDIDGTLAHRVKGGRGPFDWHRVGEDVVDESMLRIYHDLFIGRGETHDDDKFIIVTGRDEVCRPETEKWLEDNQIFYDELFMRPKDSKDRDVDVKITIYREKIYDKYDVIAVFDDRDQVVKMWRDVLGLKCLQCAYGDF